MTDRQVRMLGLAILSVGAAIISLMRDDIAPAVGGVVWLACVCMFAVIFFQKGKSKE